MKLKGLNCPYCKNNTINIFDKLSITYGSKKKCSICETEYFIEIYKYILAALPLALSMLLAIFFESLTTKILIVLVGSIIYFFLHIYIIPMSALEDNNEKKHEMIKNKK